MEEAALDDAFATFLNEVDNVTSPLDADPGTVPPSPKRQRTEEPTDLPALAEKLRKTSYLGQLSGVEKLLRKLSPVDRLLMIDDADKDDGFTALHLAVIQGHLDVAKALLQHRADVDCASRDGDTPLMWAAHLGSKAACKVLLRAGADVTLKNKRGHKATLQAKTQGHRQIHEMLDNHEFDVAAGLRRRAASTMDAAAARRAANMKMVEEAIKAAKEKEEEDAFWANVKARREARERGEAENYEAPAWQKAANSVIDTDLGLDALPAAQRPRYRLLDVPADATEDEVRRAYRKLALRHHPDKNPEDPVGAKQRFTEVALAYEAVCDYLASKAGKGMGATFAPPSNI